MLHPKKDRIQLHDTDLHKGVIISLWSDDLEKIEMFKGLGYLNFPKSLGMFHQANCREFQLFEFWNPQTEALTVLATLMATEMNLPVDIQLTRDYRPNLIVELDPFRPFDPEMYVYNNFFG